MNSLLNHFFPAARTVLCIGSLLYSVAVPRAAARDTAISDTTAHTLREVEVTARGPRPVTTATDGSMTIYTAAMPAMSRRLGEADIINNIKLAGGVTTHGDYGSGLSVDGGDPSQCAYQIDGVTVFFPYRFGGVFSTFITPHFASARFDRNIHDADFNSRLGSRIDFRTRTRVNRLRASANIGMVSSSLTVATPAGPRADIAVSGRAAYIDRLYGPLLNRRETSINYGFHDLNATVNMHPGTADRVSVNGFYSCDRIDYGDRNYALDTRIRWTNALASLTWHHRTDDGADMSHQLAYSTFNSDLNMAMPQLRLAGGSDISRYALTGRYATGRQSFRAGYDLALYSGQPLRVSIDGLGTAGGRSTIGKRFNAWTMLAHASWRAAVTDSLTVTGGLSAGAYVNGTYRAPLVDPRLTFTLNLRGGVLTLHGGTYSQPLHRLGFSEIGLASDYTVAADGILRVQRSAGMTLRYDRRIGPMHASGDVYWRHVSAQPEYDGMLLDMTADSYDPTDNVVVSHGYNIGFNIGVTGEAGPADITLTYGYGTARRRYPDLEEWCNAVTDPGHRLNASVTVRPADGWSLGATFILASGRRYTPTDAVYIMAGNIAREYARRNSGRYPLYHRLDLSATYTFRSDFRGHTLRQYINLSLINAYGHRNVEMMSYVTDLDNGGIRPRELSSLYRFLPSISYTIEL